MIRTDGTPTIANAPPKPAEDRLLIDRSELERRIAEARAEGFAIRRADIERRMAALAEGDSNDEEIDGLRDIIEELFS